MRSSCLWAYIFVSYFSLLCGCIVLYSFFISNICLIPSTASVSVSGVQRGNLDHRVPKACQNQKHPLQRLRQFIKNRNLQQPPFEFKSRFSIELRSQRWPREVLDEVLSEEERREGEDHIRKEMKERMQQKVEQEEEVGTANWRGREENAEGTGAGGQP